MAPQNDVAQCVLNMSSLPLNLAKLHLPPSRVCGAYGVRRVRCYAPSPDMKIGLTGLASKIGVYSHELRSRKRGVQLSNSAFMTCRHHRQHRQEEERRVPWRGVIIVLPVCLVWRLMCTNLRLIDIAVNVEIQSESCKNIAKIANAVPVTLYSRVTVNVEIVVLNCEKCNQCLKCHKSIGLLFESVI